MQIFAVTLMPELMRFTLENGVIGQALKEGRWSFETINPREFTTDLHHTVDDRVFGGGDGMLMMAEPLASAIEKIRKIAPETRVIHLSPRGRKFTDKIAREWAREGRSLTFVASRYAGVDERFVESFCEDEISVGDFVVSGGDLPAALVIDAVLRHRPGVLGNQASAENDSFAQGLLESRQYTRPREWRTREVPAVLLTGDPSLIDDWRLLDSVETTLRTRPDLARELSRNHAQEIEDRFKSVATRLDREQRIQLGMSSKKSEKLSADKPVLKEKALAEIAERLESAEEKWTARRSAAVPESR